MAETRATANEWASRTTAVEHESILKAIHALERALVSPAPGREEGWRRRTAAALTVVVDELRQHVESGEGSGGLLAQVEVCVGRPDEWTRVHAGHQRLLAEAGSLLGEVAGGGSVSAEDMRQRATRLTADLRQHQGLEADLILTAFDLDIGAGD